MTTKTKPRFDEREFTLEATGWITFRRQVETPSPDLVELLKASADPRPGNVRFANDNGQLVQLAEVRSAEGLLTPIEACNLLEGTAAEAKGEVADDELACLLGETGIEWTQSDDESNTAWYGAVNDPSGRRCELKLSAVLGGVEVTCQVVGWDRELTATSQAAIARFLVAAHSHLRFVRFQLSQVGVVAASFATHSRLATELPTAIAAVVAACVQTRRELLALQNEKIASEFVEAMH